MKKLFIFICISVFFMTGITKTYGENFEFNWGVVAGWNSIEGNIGGFEAFTRLFFGWTTADISYTTRFATRSDIAAGIARPGELIHERYKDIKPFDMDFLFDINLGFPISQGGLIFNLYPLSFLGVGAGGGWAAGFKDVLDDDKSFDDKFIHSPYIRGTVFFSIIGFQLGAIYDYLFYGGYSQIGGYFSYLF